MLSIVPHHYDDYISNIMICIPKFEYNSHNLFFAFIRLINLFETMYNPKLSNFLLIQVILSQIMFLNFYEETICKYLGQVWAKMKIN